MNNFAYTILAFIHDGQQQSPWRVNQPIILVISTFKIKRGLDLQID